MRNITSLLVLFAIFGASAAYADNFHIQNHTSSSMVATVYFNGKLETTRTLQPGQEYVHSFWHNLVVTVELSNPKTQRSCALIMAERYYRYKGHQDMYEPKITEQSPNCLYYSSFDQDNWHTYRDEPQGFSTVDVWAPWF